MTNLQVFDFRSEFNLHEVVSLCIGRNPRLAVPEPGEDQRTEYAELMNAARTAATGGTAACALAFIQGEFLPSLPKGPLYPIWALQRVPADDEFGAFVKIDGARWPEEGFDPGPPENWIFGRARIAQWLEGRNFKPAYDFAGAGGPFVTEVAAMGASKTRAADTRTRHTLLKIIYAMATAAPYRFNPGDKRSEAATIIASATDAAGCPVTAETVRSWLNEAAAVAR